MLPNIENKNINPLAIMIIKLLTRVVILIIGIVILTAFIWYRFVRERLPKNIPFNLTEYGCLILIYICCIYLFVVVTLMIPFKVQKNHLIAFMDLIYKPLKVLDESTKSNPLINKYFNKLLSLIADKITEKHILKIYYIFNIVPRFIVVTMLCLDIFWFHHIKYLYKIILIGIVPFIYKYMIYSFKYAKEQYILGLEPMVNKIMTDYNEDPKDDDWNFMPMREFIEIQTSSIFIYNRKYSCSIMRYPSYVSKVVEEKLDYDQICTEHAKTLDLIILISVHIETFIFYHESDDIIKYLKIGVFSTYLICWSYVLVKSLPMLPVNAFQWLWIIQDIEDPFSFTNQ
jgi:hypothetical protein